VSLVLALLFALTAAAPLGAATLHPASGDRIEIQSEPPLEIFPELVMGWVLSYRAPPGYAPIDMPRVAVKLSALAALSLGVALVLPRRRTPYAARAVAAVWRILWIIARKPFDRCAERWASRPRRLNSAPASIPSTSSTVNPL